MFIDSRQLDSDATIESDVCIIGAGAAGITLARALTRDGNLSVAVLSGGGMAPDGDSQQLADGTSLGDRYFPPIAAAMRTLGGNTTHWGSWCRRFDPLDFAARDWVADSGWPFSEETLEPFYQEAHEILQLGAQTYNPHESVKLLNDEKFAVVDLPSPQLETKVWRFHKPPVCFGRDHEAELSSLSQLRIFLHANATDILLNDARTAVEEIVGATLSGKKFRFRARAFILGMGGIQNPRLLLAANSQLPNGIGNEHDLVGRYFMDHPHLHHNGIVILSDIDRYPTLYDTNSQYSRMIVGGFCPTPDFQAEARILNCAVNFKPSHRSVASTGVSNSIGESLSAFWDDVCSLPGKAYRRLRKSLGYKNTSAPERRYLDVITRGEQAPNWASRVTIGNERDALGVPKVVIDWRVLGIDRRTMQVVHEKLSAAFAAANFGRMKVELEPSETPDLAEWNGQAEVGRFEGGWHQMGTTRMSTDPKRGVVDAECKLHSLTNLYVAGSSVFPTSSAFNPTMTIVALALRLADHLKRKLSDTPKI